MRLIDADELMDRATKNLDMYMFGVFKKMIEEAPTIEAPVVAEIKIDTDALIERIKKEYDIAVEYIDNTPTIDACGERKEK